MVSFLFLGGLVFVASAVVMQVLPASVRVLLPDSSEEATLPPQYLWSVLLAILAFNMFAYENSTVAIGTGAFAALIVVSIFSALGRHKRTFFAYACLAIGVLASLAFGFRANEFVQEVNTVVVLLAVGSLFFVHSVDRIEWNAAWLLRTVFCYPVVFFRRLPGAIRLLKPAKITGVSIFLRIVGITFVLVFFFAAILSSADPIFAEKISVLREEVVPRTLLSIVLACAFLLGFAAAYGKNYTYKPLPLKFLSWMETAVPVGAVCVLFGVFLWVQATYLFADAAAFKALDITYADYVRKGMIEVLFATAFAGVISYVVSLKQRELHGSSETNILRVVNAILVFELFLMLASALKRDWLYMDVYGLTRVRVVGEIFLAWLAVIILLIAAFALWKRLQEKAVFAGAIAACVVVVVYLNVFNMDAHIVSAAPPNGQKPDVYYMSMLSVDATDAWESMISGMAREYEEIRTKTKLTNDERMRLANIALATQKLVEKRALAVSTIAEPDWRDWRWADAYAAGAMTGSIVFRDTLDCLYHEIDDYRMVHDLLLSEEVSFIVNEYDRPFVSDDEFWTDDFPYMAAREDLDDAETCLR